MVESEQPAFVALLIGLQAVKPGKELTREALQIWWATFAPDWTLEEFKRAAIALNLQEEFMPNAAHFAKWRRAQRELARPTAAEAWERACKHASSSAYRNGPLGDPAIDLAVSGIGGYLALAMCEQPELHFLERRFTEHYRETCDVSDARAAAGIAAPAGSPLLTDADKIEILSTPHGPQSVANLLKRIK